ncbi:MAG: YceI family protein [Oceanospirillaceae bacterium]|nr:YceI family protein [Oceanospirillaceae bacterium]MCP5334456.1 YceI family protein [Oceanospirillaceae bacterium]MCP5350836.1 YceI family protein [Oceanospirillaceae bacterium]
MKKFIAASAISLGLFSAPLFAAENYTIDTKGMHAFVEFKISHLGTSWLKGRFNDFNGTFSYDDKTPANNKVSVTIKTASVDTNHAERNKHLRSKDFLDTDKFPEAKFESTKVEKTGAKTANIYGKLSLHGVTKDIVIAATEVGAGNDPWGGFRRGFEGTTTLKLKDFGINYNLGPASETVEMHLNIEGIRQ